MLVSSARYDRMICGVTLSLLLETHAYIYIRSQRKALTHVCVFTFSIRLIYCTILVVTCENNAAPLSPVSSVASAGALEVLASEGRIFKAAHLHSFLIDCRTKGWFVAGTHLQPDSVSPEDLPKGVPTVYVIGNEGHGLRPTVLKCCDKSVRIPMAADVLKDENLWRGPNRQLVDSLNVGVATGIVLRQALYNRVKRDV